MNERAAGYRAGQPDAGPGRRLAVDVGGARVGVALSDPSPVLASPLTTLRRDESGGSDLARLAQLVAENEVVEVVVGMPVTLTGRHGTAAQTAQRYGDALAPLIAPVPVRFSDERLTTAVASRVLAEQGVRGKRRRSVVDQVAAVEILQAWLDARANTLREDLP